MSLTIPKDCSEALKLTHRFVWRVSILLKSASKHLGKTPPFVGVPFIVCVLPDPVIPYMKHKPGKNYPPDSKNKFYNL